MPRPNYKLTDLGLVCQMDALNQREHDDTVSEPEELKA